MNCYYKCSGALPHVVVGWSAVCDCGISWSYSLIFWVIELRLKASVNNSSVIKDHTIKLCLLTCIARKYK